MSINGCTVATVMSSATVKHVFECISSKVTMSALTYFRLNGDKLMMRYEEKRVK